MKNVLVTASTFPRWDKDTIPGFVDILSRKLSKDNNIIVLAPHYPGAKTHETFEKMEIYRFKYFFPENLQRLCYDGGILPNLKRSFLAKIQVPFFLLSQMFSMIWLVHKRNIDLVHAHWVIPQGFIAAILKKIYKIPLIITVHAGDIFPLKNKILRFFAGWAINSSDYCTVNSKATKNEILKLKNKQNISIIPMGVDLNLFSPDKKSGLLRKNLKISGPMLLSIGRLAEKKGFRYLIKAIPDVIKKFPKVKLVIIGDGPEKNKLSSIVRDLNLDDNVLFLGELRNKLLPSYYASSDVFILPSIIAQSGDTEGLGVVLLEAIASGTAVIGSNVGGIPDIIKDNITGLLVKQKDPKQIADAILRLLSDKNLRTNLSKNAQEHIRDNYSWDIVLRKFQEIYGTL